MSNNKQHDASLERAGGMFPPLVKIEGDDLLMELLHLQTLRAVVPLGWALPPHAYAGEVIKRADRLLNAYYGADPAQCWTGGGSTAYVYSQGRQSWLAVMPDPNSVARAFSATIKAHVRTIVRFDAGADQSSQAEVLAGGLLALGLVLPVLGLAEVQSWRDSFEGLAEAQVSTGIWSVWPEPRRDCSDWFVTLGTDCYHLMRGDPITLGSDATEEALTELKRAVDTVSILNGGGGPAGIRVDVADALRPLSRLRVLPSDGSTPLLTPEEALCRVAGGFPGSELAHWASVRSPSLVEHAVEISGVSLSLRRLLFLNGCPRRPREVVEDLVRAARTAELDAYSAEVVDSGRGDKVLRLERAENKAGSASLAEALLEIASDDCSECVAWCEAFELAPLSRGRWRGRLCLENGRWCLWLRTSRHAMLETGLPPGNIAWELHSAGKLVEQLFLGGSVLVADDTARVEVRPADGTECEDIRTAAAWMVTDWLTYSFPDGDGDGDLLRYLDRRRQAIVAAADSDNNSNNDKEA